MIIAEDLMKGIGGWKMNKAYCVIFMWIAVLGLMASAVQAKYYDADEGSGGNTVCAIKGKTWYSMGAVEDGLWGRREFGYGNDGKLNSGTRDVFEASGVGRIGSGSEDCPVIVTTVSGLTTGRNYDVKVVYWSTDSENWNIRAGFSIESMILFDRLGNAGAMAGAQTGWHDDNRVAMVGTVGTVEADANGQIKVYVDDLPTTRGIEFFWSERSWYDGLIVEESVSQPVLRSESVDNVAKPASYSCSNAGFESGDYTGWMTRGKGWSIDKKVFAEGTCSALCKVEKGDKPETRACLQELEGIDANRVVEVSLDVSGVNVAQVPHSKACLAILCMDASGNVLKEYRSGMVRPRSAFQQITIDDAVVLPGTERVYVMLVVEVFQTAGEKNLWRFDNVKIKLH